MNVRLGRIPESAREQLGAACDLHLGGSIENGLTMDEVLAALRQAGYHDYRKDSNRSNHS